MTNNEAEARRLIAEMDYEELMHFHMALIDNAADKVFQGEAGQKVWNKCMDLVLEALLTKVLQ